MANFSSFYIWQMWNIFSNGVGLSKLVKSQIVFICEKYFSLEL